MKNYLNILTEEKNRILDLHNKQFLHNLNPNKWDKPIREEAEIIKPPKDPYAYKKDGDKYFIAKIGKDVKPDENTQWKPVGSNYVSSIESKIFSPEGRVSAITQDVKWQSFPCVPTTQGAVGRPAGTNDGTVIFTIGDKDYYNNGRWVSKDSRGSYKCDGNKIVLVGYAQPTVLASTDDLKK